MKHLIHGVNCAAATPVTAEGLPDQALFVAHCRALLAEGCHGIALLGTTGEANSFGLDQRRALLEAAVDGGVAATCLLPGTSTPSIEDTVTLTRHAVDIGVQACVLLPPFYYKNVTDEGLYEFYSRVIEGVGDDRLRVVLYHIPQVSAVPISHELIAGLLEAFPGTVCAIKDSGGELQNMQAMCERFPDLAVLAGADPILLPLLQAGGAGCITATSNVRADVLRTIWNGWSDPSSVADVERAQAIVVEWRNLTNRYAQLPAVKAMLAHKRDSDVWMNVMPPLVPLTEPQRRDIWQTMERLDVA